MLNFVDTVTQSLWNGLVLSETPVSLAKLKLVADATYARCDAKDGLKDGLIDDPRRCDFDPARDVAQCPAGQDGDNCLTPAQAAAVKKIHEGLKVNGKPHLFGYPIGAEATGLSFTAGGKMTSGWDMWLTPPPGRSRSSTPSATASCATGPRPRPIRRSIRRSSTSTRTWRSSPTPARS